MKKILVIICSLFLLSIDAYAFDFHIGSIDTRQAMYDVVKLGIYDPQGKYSGINFNNPGTSAYPSLSIRESPYFQFGSYAEPTEDGGVENIRSFIDGSTPSGTSGICKLLVYGQKLDKYRLEGWAKERLSREFVTFTITGFIDIGQIKYYELNYVLNQNIIITRIATPNDLIADITTAQKLNLIGNSKFVFELTKEINEIEAEKTKGKVEHGLTPAQKAKKEYTELLSEITEKYNKPESDEYVKKEAYDVLKEDIEYIINHIQ